jgi:hypothetical protein
MFADGNESIRIINLQGVKMLPRKTILIATVLTAFFLSMLGGVAMALKQPAAAAAAAVTPVAPVSLSAQEAAAVAANVLNQQDIYSVESSALNGVSAYQVVFSSGQVAFVGLDGQILSISQIKPVVVALNNPAPAPAGFASAPVVSRAGGEHEGGEREGGDD